MNFKTRLQLKKKSLGYSGISEERINSDSSVQKSMHQASHELHLPVSIIMEDPFFFIIIIKSTLHPYKLKTVTEHYDKRPSAMFQILV
jgi:hypothetical protein